MGGRGLGTIGACTCGGGLGRSFGGGGLAGKGRECNENMMYDVYMRWSSCGIGSDVLAAVAAVGALAVFFCTFIDHVDCCFWFCRSYICAALMLQA